MPRLRSIDVVRGAVMVLMAIATTCMTAPLLQLLELVRGRAQTQAVLSS